MGEGGKGGESKRKLYGLVVFPVMSCNTEGLKSFLTVAHSVVREMIRKFRVHSSTVQTMECGGTAGLVNQQRESCPHRRLATADRSSKFSPWPNRQTALFAGQ